MPMLTVMFWFHQGFFFVTAGLIKRRLWEAKWHGSGGGQGTRRKKVLKVLATKKD